MATIASPATNPLVPTRETGATAAATFEHLLQSAQRVIAKRIDLALLEAREIASETLDRAVWVAIGVVLATVAWISLAMSVVLLLFPEAVPTVRIAMFALLNGLAAIGALAYASSSKREVGARPTASIEEIP